MKLLFRLKYCCFFSCGSSLRAERGASKHPYPRSGIMRRLSNAPVGALAIAVAVAIAVLLAACPATGGGGAAGGPPSYVCINGTPQLEATLLLTV